MTGSDSKWSDIEEQSLISQLVQVQWKVNIADTYTMGYLVLGASTKLSREFGRTVTRAAVVSEILYLRDRYANFVCFCGLSGVSYNQWNNTVTVTDAYWADDRKESWRMVGYRLRGETMYRDLKTTFVIGRADVADFDWLVRSFTEEEGVCLPSDHGWPVHNFGVAEELTEEGYVV